MSPSLTGLTTPRSFKDAFNYRPAGYRTPSPPIDAFEPPSPLRDPYPHQPPTSVSATSKKRKFQGPEAYGFYPVPSEHSRKIQNPSNHAASRHHADSSHRRSVSQAAQASPTPLDVFATVAISPSLGTTNAATFPDNQLHSNGEPIGNASQRPSQWSTSTHRSSKRSRSEVIDSNSLPYSQMRPATSHIPQSTWTQQRHPSAYSVRSSEDFAPLQSLSNGQQQHREAITDNTVEDAELLLLFSRGQNARHHSPPQHVVENSHRFGDRFELHQDPYLQLPPSTVKHEHHQSLELPGYPHNPPKSDFNDMQHRQDYAPAETTQHFETYQSQTQANPQQILENGQPQSVENPYPKGKPGRGWPKGKPRGRKPKGLKLKGKDESSKPPKPPPKKRGRKPKARKPKGDDTQNGAENGDSQTKVLPRRHSFSATPQLIDEPADASNVPSRSSSAPPTSTGISRYVVATLFGAPTGRGRPKSTRHTSVCASCKSFRNSLNGFHDFWVCCNGCKSWFHHICVGFKTEREVRDVDKFYCQSCQPKHGPTTFVRKSSRAHASVDYAGLNEGKLRTSTDEPEHHYIKPIKDGSIQFQPETFPRMRPELVTAEYFQKCGTMSEPILIPASMNPRPEAPRNVDEVAFNMRKNRQDDTVEETEDLTTFGLEYDCVFNEGQDKLDMVIPQGLTVRAVAELYGPEEKVEVIDVKSQEGEDKRWNMRQWAEYYEAEGEKPVRNVISLEVSASKLGRLIQRPKVVRDLDLQDAVWPRDEMAKGIYPRVQFYCLMSVADCYTDFHIDFGGSSVYYHILKGRKTFFFIPPKKQHLKKYEEWCLSSNQGSTFLGHETKECYRVDLYEGDTMLIPSGWIHAVWTPENSLVIGGNFLTRMHYGMQIQINEIEKNTQVARKFRYPFFQRVLWYTTIDYLQEDPIPSTVVQAFYEGKMFDRSVPVYDETDEWLEDDDEDVEYSNARYYCQGEIDGLQDLLRYILRTVMISLGKIPGVSKRTQEAVIRSLPKGYGDPVDLVKTFALWIAWKVGNEEIPQWAYPDASLPDAEPAIIEKKANTGPKKKGERRSSRQIANEQAKENVAPPDALGIKVEDSSAKETLLDSTLSARRLACEACRQRRIRCKHKEEISTPEVAERFGIKVIRPPQADVLNDDKDIDTNIDTDVALLDDSVNFDAHKPVSEGVSTLVAVVIDQEPVNEQIPTDSTPSLPVEGTPLSRKQSKSRACVECRKSKRRCIHDENGEIDPIKAQESPIARGSHGSKRVRADSDAVDENANKIKSEIDLEPHIATTDVAEAQVEGKIDDSMSQEDIENLKAEEIHHANQVDYQVQREANSTVDPPEPAQDSVVLAVDPPVESSGIAATEPADHLSGRENSVVVHIKSEHQVPSSVASPEIVEANMKAALEPQELPSPESLPAVSSKGPETQVNGVIKPEPNLSDNRSRTPSSHVQTNVTESIHTSTSPPTSPLTEIDPSSPVKEELVAVVNGKNIVKSAASERTRRTPQGRKQVEQYTSVTFDKQRDAQSEKTPRATSEASSRTPSGTKRKASNSSQRQSKTPRRESTVIDEAQETPTRTSLSQGKSQSPLLEEDSESARLARELQEQEFGLRRRR